MFSQRKFSNIALFRSMSWTGGNVRGESCWHARWPKWVWTDEEAGDSVGHRCLYRFTAKLRWLVPFYVVSYPRLIYLGRALKKNWCLNLFRVPEEQSLKLCMCWNRLGSKPCLQYMALGPSVIQHCFFSVIGRNYFWNDRQSWFRQIMSENERWHKAFKLFRTNDRNVSAKKAQIQPEFSNGWCFFFVEAANFQSKSKSSNHTALGWSWK